jgi:predicted Fe-Mo cluster-binding NifX family protein
MKVCFPVEVAESLENEVYGHFGSAPAFIIADSDTRAITVINNSDQHHNHGQCSPIRALGGHEIDCVIVGGIGGGALMKLNQAGIRVFKASPGTIRKNLDLFAAGSLTLFQPGLACQGHSHGSTCSHH